MDVKKYPIRVNKNIVNIPMYKYHVCDKCVIVIELDGNNFFPSNFNLSYEKCKNENKLCIESVNVYNYGRENENIVNSDDIVIENETFSICIDKICKKPFKVKVDGKQKKFTVDNLIKMCRKILYYMYYKEEQTSPLKNYMIKKSCECVQTNEYQQKYIENMPEEKWQGECVICNEDDDCNFVHLNCNHYYHKNCIKQWSKQSKLCPLCRQNFIKCQECNNEGFIYIHKTCKILPPEFRLSYLRPKTDGIFKLGSLDINKIYIDGIKYDTHNKILYFNFS